MKLYFTSKGLRFLQGLYLGRVEHKNIIDRETYKQRKITNNNRDDILINLVLTELQNNAGFTD